MYCNALTGTIIVATYAIIRREITYKFYFTLISGPYIMASQHVLSQSQSCRKINQTLKITYFAINSIKRQTFRLTSQQISGY